MRKILLSSALLFALCATPVLVATAHAEGEAAHEEGLSLRRIVSGELPEGSSEEEVAEAKHETMSFWGSVVNFTLLVIILVRSAKKPISSFLAGRRDEIARGLNEAAEMKAKAEAIFNEYNTRMQSLDSELAKLRSDMASAAEQDKAKIIAEAEESSRRLRTETEAMIARQGEQLEAQIRREVVEAAMQAAERAVREKTTSEDQRRLAEAFAREIGARAAEKPAAARETTTEKRA